MTTKEPRTPLEVCQRWQAELHCDMMNAQKNRGIMIPREAAAAHMAVVCLMEEIAALPTGWQPIATAPRDGREVLGWHKGDRDQDRRIVMAWDSRERAWLTSDRHGCHPTHWQPLPAPPETAP